MIYIYTELGNEKLCSCCGEYYPHDGEFFFSNGFKNGKPKFTAQCKACYIENYRKGAVA